MVIPMQSPVGTMAASADGDRALPIPSRTEAEGYVAMVCFKHGPPRLHGVELEWTVHHAADPARPLDTEDLRRALGPHCPLTLDPDSPHRPLAGGSLVTVEPGGQVEISTAPSESVSTLIASTRADATQTGRLLESAGLVRGEHAIDAHRPPRRILHTPRYDAMQDYLDGVGPHGVRMMCSTASLQVCLDAGEAHEVAARWRAVHALGPALTALFANSPTVAGRDTGWASSRLRSTLATAPPVTDAPTLEGDPSAAYARMALDAPLLCLRRPTPPWTAPAGATFADWLADPSPGGAFGRPATWQDLDYHLTTLFPPVRPHGYLEVRYLDAQPGDGWIAPVALLTALTARAATIDRVLDLTGESADRWLPAARDGLADPVVARAAVAVVELGCAAMADTDLDRGLAGEVHDLLLRALAAAPDRRPVSRRCSAWPPHRT